MFSDYFSFPLAYQHHTRLAFFPVGSPVSKSASLVALIIFFLQRKLYPLSRKQRTRLRTLHMCALFSVVWSESYHEHSKQTICRRANLLLYKLLRQVFKKQKSGLKNKSKNKNGHWAPLRQVNPANKALCFLVLLLQNGEGRIPFFLRFTLLRFATALPAFKCMFSMHFCFQK